MLVFYLILITNDLNSGSKQPKQVIDIEDEDVAEISKTMAIGPNQKDNSRKGPQAADKGAEGANKGKKFENFRP